MRGIAIVIIGRNEGERLVRCLRSAATAGAPMVYVDSGSTDGSIDRAREVGAETVELDMSKPFTAARGRNAGLARLHRIHSEVRYVQLVDGDCELAPGWMHEGAAFLEAHPRAAAVFGRLRERSPDASIYNRLSELEWDETSVGEAMACGGIVMMRAEALREAGGFREDLIAGEEPELCVRLRERGWSIHRVAAEMAWHDAAMMRFGQWWKRSIRAGYASAEGAWLHGHRKDRHGVRTVASAVLWAAVIPMTALMAAWPTHGWSLLLLALYPLQWARLTARQLRRGRPFGLAWRHAALLLVGKFAHLVGLCRFVLGAAFRRPAALMEYKAADHPRPAGGATVEGPT